MIYQEDGESRESVPSVVRDGPVMNPHDAAILDGCGISYDHTAKAGDLECQRCGAELSLEDGLRAQGLTVAVNMTPILPPSPSVDVEERLAQMNRALTALSKRIAVPPEMLGLPPADPEPDTYEIVQLPFGWWALRHVRSGTDIVKAHGAGAREDITERWNAKAVRWLEWRDRWTQS